jgi:ADP-ribosylglycohydrolase
VVEGIESNPEREVAAKLEPLRSRARGCLLAGALGDALGAPLEFLTLASIRARFGPEGATRPERAYGRLGAITDDTQMTLFTAEGLIRAWVRGRTRGIGHPPSVVHHAYLRWLHTQGVPWQRAAGEVWAEDNPLPDGWLVGEAFLHTRRAPGNTCLESLSHHDGLGSPAVNSSKGCGGVMRIAPVGLLPHAGTGGEPTATEGIFRLAVEIAALTHGHASGQLPAGVAAATIHGVVYGGLPLERALDRATEILERHDEADETLDALETARDLARRGHPSPEKLQTLGAGWVAEEALAIAVYAALSHPADLRAALLLAVNHSGDSDSTGAICGHLLGAELGEAALPPDWLPRLEGRRVIERLADDLVTETTSSAPLSETWEQSYPGW